MAEVIKDGGKYAGGEESGDDGPDQDYFALPAEGTASHTRTQVKAILLFVSLEKPEHSAQVDNGIKQVWRASKLVLSESRDRGEMAWEPGASLGSGVSVGVRQQRGKSPQLTVTLSYVRFAL